MNDPYTSNDKDLPGGIVISHRYSTQHPKTPYVVYRGKKFLARISSKERDLLIHKTGEILKRFPPPPKKKNVEVA